MHNFYDEIITIIPSCIQSMSSQNEFPVFTYFHPTQLCSTKSNTTNMNGQGCLSWVFTSMTRRRKR